MKNLPLTLFAALLACHQAAFAALAAPQCSAESGASLTPVVELYTSEGCSSCPPADQWLSGLQPYSGQLVVQAFHVNYWDYIGWTDRFANPSHTQRQRDIAAANGLRGIYTPQLVLGGRDWPRWGGDARQLLASPAPAQARLHIQRTQGSAQGDTLEASVQPLDAGQSWTAYWTVTEHGWRSKVSAGENRGETLAHDFVVRQYVPVGQYKGAQTLRLSTIAPQAGHARQVNLVVQDAKSGKPLQALGLSCG